MKDPIQIFSIPFERILYGGESFIIDSGGARYRLSTGVGEHYIMMNLAGPCKRNGTMIMGLAQKKGKPSLLPVAIVNGNGTTWIAIDPDDRTRWPAIPDPSPIEHLRTDAGQEYPDGFIEPSRTSLSYTELMHMERALHDTNYVEELYHRYRTLHPDKTPYDARLHYFMIKGIRKHKNYTDDFITPCDEFSFYIGWQDPFPWYLYIKTFGRIDAWPSHAKMRLMADNRCQAAIPLALKVLASDKAHDRIKHYALVIAGMDPANDAVVMAHREKYPRAVARVLYERGSADLYPMLLDNARNILAGSNDDILDDLPVIFSRYYDKMDEYTVSHRGFIRLDTLDEEQVRGLWEFYRQIAQRVADTKDCEDRLRLGNAFRAFLLAVIYNATPAVAEILDDIYRNFNFLLYGEWSQDSKYKSLDIMWANYLYGWVVKWNIVDNFWEWLQFHAKRYDHYYLYTNQHFFLSIYSKVAYHMVESATFYDALAPLIDSNYVLVEDIWRGVTGDECLTDDMPPLDHRWENMFRDYNYYAWTGKAMFYYSLVRNRILPHPAGWNGEWEPEDKKLDIVVPR